MTLPRFQMFSKNENIDKVIFHCKKEEDSRFRNWLEAHWFETSPLFDPYMHLRLYKVYQNIFFKNLDHFIVVCGKEGVGKSTLALNIALTFDPTFNLDRVCFSTSEYLQQVGKAEKGQAFILDEGNLFLFSRESYSDTNRILIKLFALMRQKNLLTIINVPNFFTLDPYVRDHRVDTVVYCYKRGNYLGVIDKGIKKLSKDGSRLKTMGGFQYPDGSTWFGSWHSQVPKKTGFSWEKYSKHKGTEFNAFLIESQQIMNNKRQDSPYITIKTVKDYLPVRDAAIKRLIAEKAFETIKVGNKIFVNKASLLKYMTDNTSKAENNEDNDPIPEKDHYLHCFQLDVLS